MGPVFQVESLQTGDEVPCIARGQGKGAVVGDLVYYEAVSNLLADGLILEFSPRQSLLQRTDSGGRRAQLIAANLDVIFIVVAPLPELREGLIDRYLVAASSQDIEAEIILNKTDLLTDPTLLQGYLDRLSRYEPLGIPVHRVSARSAEGLDELAHAMADRTSIVVGHSGVGKTSLLNALCPGVEEKVNAISEASGKGQHTTTTSALYTLPNGGELIDSPGIRSFGLWGMEANDLQTHFPEFSSLAAGCRFGDCQHLDEPHCAVKDAVAEGIIDARRYESYLTIRSSLLAEDNPR